MVKRIFFSGLSLPILAALLACGEAPTEIILTIDADPGVEAMIDHLELIADDGRSEPRVASTDIEAGAFPKTIGLFEEAEAAGPILIEVIGRLDGKRRIEARVRIPFEEGASIRHTIHLFEECVGVFSCTEETSCGRGGACAPIDAR